MQTVMEKTQEPAQQEYVAPKRKPVYDVCKRIFDLFMSVFALILLSPVFLGVAIAIKIEDGGKVFYKHKRVGKDGKEIYLRKFRSMVKDADKIQIQLTPEQQAQYEREYKVDDDPRITKLGKILRKTSLDELPNMFAVFTGDISIIGPRPIMREEAEAKYGDDMEKLLSVKPGLVGWWVVNGRSNCTYDSGERQKSELYYVDHCSVGFDIKILFKTVGKVLKRDGAQ